MEKFVQMMQNQPHSDLSKIVSVAKITATNLQRVNIWYDKKLRLNTMPVVVKPRVFDLRR